MCLGVHVLLLYHLRGMVFPIFSPSHQEACTSPFSSSIRQQTEWKPQSQKTNKNDHMDHSLVNSMKLWAMLWRASQDGQDMVQSFDKTPTQHACLENTMNRMKRQKYMTLKHEPLGLVSVQYPTGEEWRNNSKKKKKIEEAEAKWKHCPVVDAWCDSPML